MIVLKKTVTVIALFGCLLVVGYAMSNLRPHRFHSMPMSHAALS